MERIDAEDSDSMSVSESSSPEDEPLSLADKKKEEALKNINQEILGEVEYFDKAGIVIDILDSDNDEEDAYGEDDYFGEKNLEYKAAQAESKVQIPELFDNNEGHQPRRQKQVIKRHIAHDQEVNSLSHSASLDLDRIPFLDRKKIQQYYSHAKKSLSFMAPILNHFSKDHLRSQLSEKLKQIDRKSEAWKEVKIRGDPYSELDEKFFQRYSGYKLASVNYYTDFVKSSNISSINGNVVFGDNGGYSEYLLWTYISKAANASCVILPETGLKEIDTRNYNKEIPDVDKCLLNLKSRIGDIENNVRFFTKEKINEVCTIIEKFMDNQELMTLIASKKIPYETEMNQELDFAKYMVLYTIFALRLLSKGGSFVLRAYDCNLPFTCSLLLILHLNFEKITIIKPLSSNLHSAERFIVANGFLYEPNSQKELIDDLTTIFELCVGLNLEDKDITNVIDLPAFQNYIEFKKYVTEENNMIAEWRIHTLGNLLEFMKQPYKELGNKDQVKDLCLNLWGVPILHKTEEKTEAKRPQPELDDYKSDEEKDELVEMVRSRERHRLEKLNANKRPVNTTKHYYDITNSKPVVPLRNIPERKKFTHKYFKEESSKPATKVRLNLPRDSS